MTYNLSSVTFTNDFAFIELNSGDTIVLNIIDEQIMSGNDEISINQINMAVITNDGEQLNTNCIIGMPDSHYSLKTDYKEYLGQVLNKDNIKYCTLEVKDD